MSFTAAEASAELKKRGQQHVSIYVYEAPLRLWHWVNALAVTVLCVTGYFIGSPPPSVPGEASEWFLMGYIRFAHFSAGYVLAIGFIGRLYWAVVGNQHARQLFILPIWSRKWWSEVLFEAKWYLFIERTPKKYVGHNPLAQLVMFTVFLFCLLFMIITGFALYGEGQGIDSWQYAVFGWVFDIWPNSQSVHTWHHLGMWVMISFVIVHVYAAIREDIMSRQNMISTIINGERTYKDDD